MTQISKGDTFVDGQQVTGSRLNQLVDSAQILIGAITDQVALTSATVAADDQFLVSDTSTGLLKKTTAGDILGSSLPVVASTVTSTSVTASVVNAGLNSDIVVTPYDGISVSGKAFTSSDGITATVTSTAHGLVAGMLVNITASVTAYSGQYIIVVPTVDTFSYSVYPTTTAASGTCSYTRKASERVIGNLTVVGESNIAGNETVGGNLRVMGTATINGKTPMTTQDNAIKVYTKCGTASGATGGGSVQYNVYSLPTLPTIPSDETWTYEFWLYADSGNLNGNTRPTWQGVNMHIYNDTTLVIDVHGSTSAYGGTHMCAFHSLVGVSGAKYIIKISSQSGEQDEPRYMVKLTKIKTSAIADASTCI